ncbi:MAG: TIGR02186 family protein [Rhodospirillales bacterium]|nr:TIGR02186 family protein [Rhodospirillales bacterium]
MMFVRGLVVLLILLFALLESFPVRAAQDDLTVGLAADRVDISTGFSGAKIVLFGVKSKPGDLAVVVSGPEREMRVRRKESVGGLWINRRAMMFHSVPVYYDYALSRSESDIAPLDVRRENRIGLNALGFDPETNEDPDDIGKFQEGLIRSQQIAGLYPLAPKSIVFLNDGFFRASLDVPSNVPTGEYTIRTFLIRDGRIAEMRAIPLRIAQVGLSARIYLFAHENGLLYGLSTILLAIMAGFGAHIFLRRD